MINYVDLHSMVSAASDRLDHRGQVGHLHVSASLRHVFVSSWVSVVDYFAAILVAGVGEESRL